MLTIENPNSIDWAKLPLSKVSEGNCWDTYFTLKLANVLTNKLKGEKIDRLLKYLMSPAMAVFSKMELKGMNISIPILTKLGKEILEKKSKMEDNLYRFNEVKKTFDIGKDLIKILYSCEKDKDKTWIVNNSFGFGLYPPDRTKKTGDPSTSKDSLETILRFVIEEMDRRGINEQSKSEGK